METLKKCTLDIGDYFKIHIHREKEVVYKVVIAADNFVTAQVVHPRSLALQLMNEGPFMIDVSSLCIEVIGNSSKSPLLDTIYN